jgi:hypothetical protein
MATVNPTPPSPQDWSFSSREELGSSDVKQATPDLIIENPYVLPIEIMTDLLFEDIGGEEILSLTRSDIVNGAIQEYQQIANLGKVASQFNPLNILPIQSTSRDVFREFSFQLHKYLIEGQHSVYLGNDQSIVVELQDNLGDNLKIEIEFLPSETPFNDTIYGE